MSTLTLVPEKAAFDSDEPVVLIYSSTLSQQTAPFNGSADFASGPLTVQGTATIKDRLDGYDAPTLSGYVFHVDNANPARWIGVKV